MTEHTLTEYLRGKLHIEVEVSPVHTRFNTYRTFQVQATCEDPSVFMDESLWPEGTLFRWWRRGYVNHSQTQQPGDAQNSAVA